MGKKKKKCHSGSNFVCGIDIPLDFPCTEAIMIASLNCKGTDSCDLPSSSFNSTVSAASPVAVFEKKDFGTLLSSLPFPENLIEKLSHILKFTNPADHENYNSGSELEKSDLPATALIMPPQSMTHKDKRQHLEILKKFLDGAESFLFSNLIQRNIDESQVSGKIGDGEYQKEQLLISILFGLIADSISCPPFHSCIVAMLVRCFQPYLYDRKKSKDSDDAKFNYQSTYDSISLLSVSLKPTILKLSNDHDIFITRLCDFVCLVATKVSRVVFAPYHHSRGLKSESQPNILLILLSRLDTVFNSSERFHFDLIHAALEALDLLIDPTILTDSSISNLLPRDILTILASIHIHLAELIMENTRPVVQKQLAGVIMARILSVQECLLEKGVILHCLPAGAPLYSWLSCLKNESIPIDVTSTPAGILYTARGILLGLSPSLLFLSDSISGTNIMETHLFPYFMSACERRDADNIYHLLAYQCLSSWLSTVKKAIEKNHDVFASSRKLLCFFSQHRELLIEFVFSNWNDSVDSIRHHALTIFEYIVELDVLTISPENPLEPTPFLVSTLTKVFKLDDSIKGKYGAIKIIMAKFGIKAFIRIHGTSFVAEMIKSMMHRHAADCIVQAATAFKAENHSDEHNWRVTWALPLKHSMLSANASRRLIIAELLLPRLFDVVPFLLDLILDIPRNDNEDPAICITFLCAGVRCGIVTSIMRSQFSDKITTCMMHPDQLARTSALAIVCNSKRTTEPVLDADYEMVKTFLSSNLDSSSPKFRKDSVDHIRKLLVRISSNVRREFKNSKNNKRISLQIQILNNEDNISDYTLDDSIFLALKFLRWFADLLFAGIRPMSGFQRRETCLLHLHSLIEVLGKPIENCNDIFFASTLPQDRIDLLLYTLLDPFDSNQKLALSILELVDVNPSTSPSLLLQWALYLAENAKVAHCNAAANLMQYVTKCLKAQEYLKGGTHKEFFAHDNPICYVVSIVFQKIKEISLLYKKDLAHVAHVPIHGFIHCFRILLETMEKSECEQFTQKAKNVISDIVQIIFPVVSDPCCGGNVPSHIMNKYSGDNDTFQDDDNSQTLLVNSWRAIKEIALLYGYVYSHEPHCTAIGKNLLQMLLKVQHYGAMSMLSEGLYQLCKNLKTTKSHTLPEKWLQVLIQDIVASDGGSIDVTVTRRSAGLPHAIISLISSMPKQKFFVFFGSTMNELMQFAERKYVRSETCLFEPFSKNIAKKRVHVLNLLKSLFRHSDFGSHVRPFIARGVILSLKGFCSRDWSFRNSSLMLFTALVQRIFGVKKVRLEHSSKNGMTSTEFFTNFPELYNFLLKTLTEAVKMISSSKNMASLPPMLYPTLVLLSKIYPSPTEGLKGNMKLSNFSSGLDECAKSSSIYIREAAARAASSCTRYDEIPKKIQIIADALDNCIGENHFHGLLCQASMLTFKLKGHAEQNSIENTRDEASIFWKSISMAFLKLIKVISSLRFHSHVSSSCLFRALKHMIVVAKIYKCSKQDLFVLTSAFKSKLPVYISSSHDIIGQEQCSADLLSLHLMVQSIDSTVIDCISLAYKHISAGSNEERLIASKFLLDNAGKKYEDSLYLICSLKNHFSELKRERFCFEILIKIIEAFPKPEKNMEEPLIELAQMAESEILEAIQSTFTSDILACMVKCWGSIVQLLYSSKILGARKKAIVNESFSKWENFVDQMTKKVDIFISDFVAESMQYAGANIFLDSSHLFLEPPLKLWRIFLSLLDEKSSNAQSLAMSILKCDRKFTDIELQEMCFEIFLNRYGVGKFNKINLFGFICDSILDIMYNLAHSLQINTEAPFDRSNVEDIKVLSNYQYFSKGLTKLRYSGCEHLLHELSDNASRHIERIFAARPKEQNPYIQKQIQNNPDVARLLEFYKIIVEVCK